MSRAMHKARRMASSVPRGSELLRLIESAAMRKALVKAADAHQPPVGAISEKVLQLVGGEMSRLPLLRQFVGACVRAVMDEEGYVVAKEKARISSDCMFKSGATYRKAARMEGDLLERLLHSLDKKEVERAYEIISKRRSSLIE
jgi:hypothetical protein